MNYFKHINKPLHEAYTMTNNVYLSNSELVIIPLEEDRSNINATISDGVDALYLNGAYPINIHVALDSCSRKVGITFYYLIYDKKMLSDYLVDIVNTLTASGKVIKTITWETRKKSTLSPCYTDKDICPLYHTRSDELLFYKIKIRVKYFHGKTHSTEYKKVKFCRMKSWEKIISTLPLPYDELVSLRDIALTSMQIEAKSELYWLIRKRLRDAIKLSMKRYGSHRKRGKGGTR